MPQCNQADISFLDRAEVKEINTVELPVSAERAFAVLRDADAWPKWFDGMSKLVWTSPEPYGIGTTRSVWLGPLRADEYFFDWVENQRFAFCFTRTNLPFVKTLVEEYQLEPLDGNRCRFTYTVAYDPALLLSISGPLGRAALARTFRRAARSFADFLDN